MTLSVALENMPSAQSFCNKRKVSAKSFMDERLSEKMFKAKETISEYVFEAKDNLSVRSSAGIWPASARRPSLDRLSKQHAVSSSRQQYGTSGRDKPGKPVKTDRTHQPDRQDRPRNEQASSITAPTAYAG